MASGTIDMSQKIKAPPSPEDPLEGSESNLRLMFFRLRAEESPDVNYKVPLLDRDFL
jgi:hypothetical protein